MKTKLTTFRVQEDLLSELKTRKINHGDMARHVNTALRLYLFPVEQKVEKQIVPVKTQAPKYSAKDMEFSQWAWGVLQKSMDGIKKPNLESWSKVVRLMRERDNREYRQMAEVWAWARRDTFWQSNILSMTKFREKYDTLLSQSKNPVGPNGGFLTANEKAAARAAETSKLYSEDDLEF